MKLLIADDEKLARLRLKSLIAEIDGDFQVVAEATNGLEALQKWKETQADVLLLDIRMPEMDGLDVAREIVKYSFSIAVIFTTAYSEHALQAFDANAIDYLLKPVRKERLINALNKAQTFNQSKWQGMQSLTEGKIRSHICVQVQGDMHLIAVKDILYFQADQKYVTIKTLEKDYLLDESLKSLEQEFSTQFIRVHRNALAS
ncbi:MAG: response regulator transcription factor, partial [Methylococcales bacterium]|nr:response regulator transcription factor [Methylococcales bacterium]